MEEAHSLVDSFRHFVSENKSVSPEKRDSHSNFIKFYYELLKAKDNADGIQIEELRSTLNKTNTIRDKEWLLEKLRNWKNSKAAYCASFIVLDYG